MSGIKLPPQNIIYLFGDELATDLKAVEFDPTSITILNYYPKFFIFDFKNAILHGPKWSILQECSIRTSRFLSYFYGKNFIKLKDASQEGLKLYNDYKMAQKIEQFIVENFILGQ